MLFNTIKLDHLTWGLTSLWRHSQQAARGTVVYDTLSASGVVPCTFLMSFFFYSKKCHKCNPDISSLKHLHL